MALIIKYLLVITVKGTTCDQIKRTYWLSLRKGLLAIMAINGMGVSG